MPEPKFRRPLNAKQLNLLKVIYKFRFVTVELLDKSKTKNGRDIKRKGLNILVKQNYISRNYESNYRLQNKPASYFLAPGGIKYLLANTELNRKVLHAAYYDKSARQQFIDHCLNIFAIYIKFKQLFPDHYEFFCKSELADFEYLPKLLPDAYLLNTKSSGDYFLDSIEHFSPAFITKRKLRGYVEHSESDEMDESDRDFPSVLLICGTPAIERSIQKYAAKLINTAGSDVEVYTTSLRALLESRTAKDEIWTDITEPEELLGLPPSKNA